MNQLRLILFLVLLTSVVYGQSDANLDKRYNEVTFLTTHNAYNSKVYGLKFPNQSLSITDQLQNGVRAFMFDIYPLDSTVVQYHGKKSLGTVSFVSTLTEIQQFMLLDSTTVITLIVECYAPANMIEKDLKTAGLYAQLFCKTDSVWPTLREMIESGKRLVVLSDDKVNRENYPWNHYMWDFMVDTPYKNYRTNQLDESINRGNSDNDLFLINHFLYANILGIGSKRKARKINKLAEIKKRVDSVKEKYHRIPNFIAIDFFSEELRLLVNGMNEY